MPDPYLLLRESFQKHVSISDDDFRFITDHATVKKYRRNQYMIHEGSVVRKTHFITGGAAIAYYIDDKGTEHVIQFAIEGWWISDISCFTTGLPALFNVKAIEDVSLIEFTHQQMSSIYTQVPAVQSYFLKITQNAFASFQQRILYNNSLNAEEKYRRFIEKYPNLSLRFSQKNIASYLGMSAEFLSKIKKKQLRH